MTDIAMDYGDMLVLDKDPGGGTRMRVRVRPPSDTPVDPYRGLRAAPLPAMARWGAVKTEIIGSGIDLHVEDAFHMILDHVQTRFGGTANIQENRLSEAVEKYILDNSLWVPRSLEEGCQS